MPDAATAQPRDRALDPTALTTLRSIESRLLWLATAMIHHANRVRENRSGIKVGGHQASSASMVSIMTSLWFDYLRGPDRIAVKPHASPVMHAINYLLGSLDQSYLERLREFGGLQSYSSRVKDPGPVDFSTGSEGLGATATIWSALTQRYLVGHTDLQVGGRMIALLGDAELDEGAIWEAIVDPVVPQLGELLWIVDLNRQSLDRVVPVMATDRLVRMFQAAGWHTLIVKYGRLLTELFERPGGLELRRRIDEMPNPEYQWLLRCSSEERRERLPGTGKGARKLRDLVDQLDDDTLLASLRDLGGHDLSLLLDAYREADQARDRPTAIFAYTIKGYRLPIEGHPSNHSALLTVDQYVFLAEELGTSADEPWARFPEDSAEAELCRLAAERLARVQPVPASPPAVPTEFSHHHAGNVSTQQALGRLFVDLSRDAPDVAARVVTVSADVASSTNLGGWINRVGVWSLGDRVDWFAEDTETLVRWRETDEGRHIELGIAETNLVGLLGELGAAWRAYGQPLLPVGTLYDTFVGRALEPWSFGIYAGGQSILIGTPSGVTLAPEGGAHQSSISPSIGIGQPNCIYWEPAFAKDLEWTLLYALSRLGRDDGISSFFRLSTRPIDQALAALPDDPAARDRRRANAIAGGYVLRRAQGQPGISLVTAGAVLPEVLRAAEALEEQVGVGTNVVCLTSPDLIFRAWQHERGLDGQPSWILDELFPPQERLPLVSVIDGHPHALSFLGSVRSVPITCLGVSEFGQSGDLDDLYAHHGLDVETIVGAALDLLDL